MLIRKKIISVFILIFIFSANSAFAQASKWVGNWSEVWGAGQETDVTYHDTFRIDMDAAGNITITCTNRDNYRFENIHLQRKVLTFMVVNTTGNDHLPYMLKINRKGDRLTGTAISIRGDETNIIWNRIHDPEL